MDWALYADNVRVARILLLNGAHFHWPPRRQVPEGNKTERLFRAVHGKEYIIIQSSLDIYNMGSQQPLAFSYG